MKADVLPYLRCPVCRDRLAAGDDVRSDPVRAAAGPRTVRCPRGHSFDVAKQGYVHLAGRIAHGGDTPEMLASRAEFLDAGHYRFISTALAEAVAEHLTTVTSAGDAPLVVDAGAGTGQHLGAVLDGVPAAIGLALDAAKPAVRRAARAHPRCSAVLCDTWGRFPLADESAAVLLNVFAPRNGAEFHRVLRRDGLLLVVVPDPEHLMELVGALDLLRVDPEKAARVTAGLGTRFTLAGSTAYRRTMELRRAELAALVRMGPSAWHTDSERLAAKLDALPPVMTVTASIVLSRYLPAPRLP